MWKQLVPGLIIAGVALYLTYRKTDTEALLCALRDMRWPVLLLVLPPLVLSYLFRVVRWRKLLSPMEKVSYGEASGPLITGFFVNTLLPGRVGEVLRALLLSRRTTVPRAGSFATVVLARLFDGLTLAAMTLLALTVLWDRLEAGIRAGLMAAGLLYVTVLAVMILLRRFRGRAARAFSLPLKKMGLLSLGRKTEGILMSFAEGLEIMGDWRDTVRIGLLSLLVWTSLTLSVIPVFWAMRLPMLWYYPVMVLVLAGLGMLIPTPAGTGTVHGALVLVLPGLAGITVETARVLALVFHTTQFIPVIIVGLVVAVREGVTASQVSRIAEQENEMDITGSGLSDRG